MLANAAARLKTLREQGILTDEEYHRQLHLLIVAQDTPQPAASAAPAALTVPAAPAPAEPMEVAAGTPQGAAMEAGLRPDGDHSELTLEAEYSQLDHAFARELSELAPGRVNTWQRMTASRPTGTPATEACNRPKGESWTITGAEGDAVAVPAGPHASCGQTSGPSFRQGMNMDKRRCRQLHSASFKAAIATWRAQATAVDAAAVRASEPLSPARAAATGRSTGVSAWVRKRPLLPAELSRFEYDAVAVNARLGTTTTHTCLMKPDLRRMFIRHATFSPGGGAFDEHASSEAVYDKARTPPARTPPCMAPCMAPIPHAALKPCELAQPQSTSSATCSSATRPAIRSAVSPATFSTPPPPVPCPRLRWALL